MHGYDRHCIQNAPHVSLARQYGRVLNHGKAPRTLYIPRQSGEYRSICHQGQRKLLMSEIELLTLALEKYPIDLEPPLVVYAGAAPGLHIPVLSEMFPVCTFHLYDPATFAITGSEKIKIYHREFTNADAAEYRHANDTVTPAHGKVIFISDIRTKIDEESVWNDMLTQRGWHEAMRPSLCSLKFRLPWDRAPDETCQYLEGDIYLPIWGRTSTTETRLFIDDRVHSGEKTYHPHVYEEEMSFFNRSVRPALHLHTVRDGGFDRCYDCASEIWVLRRYLQAFHVCSNMAVSALSETITEGLRKQKLRLISLEQYQDTPSQNANQTKDHSDIWREYSMETFHKRLRKINKEHPDSPKCMCISCADSGMHTEYASSCSFKKWFLDRARTHGLSTTLVQNTSNYPVIQCHDCCGDSFVLDADSHFTTRAEDDWTPIRYGARIWKISSLTNQDTKLFTDFMLEMTHSSTAEPPPPQEKRDETSLSAGDAMVS